MHHAARTLSLLLVLLAAGCAADRTPTRRESVAPAPMPSDAGATEAALWETIGRSVQGRPIEAITLGRAGTRVLIVGGIHGDEPEGGRTMSAVAAYVAALSPDATVRIIRDVNPDGTAARSRTNARGIDLNRNWPASNFAPAADRGPRPLSEPESRALAADIERFGPEILIVSHSARSGPFVNFDGPAAALAGAFADAASRSDPRWRVVPAMGYPTPGSLGSLIGVDREIPILTVEFARGHAPEAAWLAMRDGLAAVLTEAAEPLAK